MSELRKKLRRCQHPAFMLFESTERIQKIASLPYQESPTKREVYCGKLLALRLRTFCFGIPAEYLFYSKILRAAPKIVSRHKTKVSTSYGLGC